jgi:hypothetical protein
MAIAITFMMVVAATSNPMIIKIKPISAILLLSAVLLSCQQSSHQQMITLLQQLSKRNHSVLNPFHPEVKVAYYDSIINANKGAVNMRVFPSKAALSLQTGEEQKSVDMYEALLKKTDFMSVADMMPDVGIAYMRLGERSNCMLNHTGASCVFPIKNEGVHRLQTGSQKAIETYQAILRANPRDVESKWLLNIAYMTLGEYPESVPKEFLIPGLAKADAHPVKPFTDVAPDLGVGINSRAGGVIVDDFNNDGYMDIVTSGWDLDDPMHYFQNNKDGSFTDMTKQSGLVGITGGLNIQQTDYNNDGNIDIFVLRGAWNMGGFGNQPSSLLRNNGDGTFTDVTTPSGLLFFHPTQAAVWADFNNDGWLDVFIGTENNNMMDAGGTHSCMLYLNNHNGTFTNITAKAHCEITSFVKGVTSADYNNDGWPDIFISTMDGKKYLLKNKRKPGMTADFEDVTANSGIDQNREKTFTTFFYDYNNDGWPDILVDNYHFNQSLAYYAGLEAMGMPMPDAGHVYLYRNNHDGTFTEMSKELGLDKVVYSMGGNFGDIDNDGYLDMYFGTGSPDFKSLVPNKMFRNVGGKRFDDVTNSSRTGNLQKGHGVAFADFRNIGVQDIFAEMGGAYSGDAYTSSLYMNPGQSNNNWISLKLRGVKANASAIGSHIKVTFTENGVKRSVYKDVNSGGSFGSSPLQQELGIGQAKVIDEIEIKWAGSQSVQRFTHVMPNQFLKITEGDNTIYVTHLARLVFKTKHNAAICIPMVANLND